MDIRNAEEIRRLIDRGEGPTVEFKEAFTTGRGFISAQPDYRAGAARLGVHGGSRA